MNPFDLKKRGFDCCLVCGLGCLRVNKGAIKILLESKLPISVIASGKNIKVANLRKCFERDEWTMIKMHATRFQYRIPAVHDRVNQVQHISINHIGGSVSVGIVEPGERLLIVGENAVEEIVSSIIMETVFQSIQSLDESLLNCMESSLYIDLDRYTIIHVLPTPFTNETESFHYKNSPSFNETKKALSAVIAKMRCHKNRIGLVAIKNIQLEQGLRKDKRFATASEWVTFLEQLLPERCNKMWVVIGKIVKEMDSFDGKSECTSTTKHSKPNSNLKLLRLVDSKGSDTANLTGFKNYENGCSCVRCSHWYRWNSF